MSDALDARFDLKGRYRIDNFEALRKTLSNYVRIVADKKSGLIQVEVDDRDPKFAADLANAHPAELTKVLGRLAVSEAQKVVLRARAVSAAVQAGTCARGPATAVQSSFSQVRLS